MKTFIFVVILAAFLQTASIPADLVLLLILSRSLVNPDKSNLYISFASGIVLGLLTSTNLGFYALLYVLVSQIGYLLRKSPLTSNILTVIPITFLAVLFISLTSQLFLEESINITRIIVDTLLSLPIYLCVKFWEERFIVTPQVRLKLK